MKLNRIRPSIHSSLALATAAFGVVVLSLRLVNTLLVAIPDTIQIGLLLAVPGVVATLVFWWEMARPEPDRHGEPAEKMIANRKATHTCMRAILHS